MSLVSELSRGFGGQSEIEDLHLPIAGDEDVLRFEIAMNDAAVVCRREASADLHRVVQRGRERQRRSAQVWSERVSFEELDGDVWDPVAIADVVNREDVGVRQCGDGAGLAIEPLAHRRVGERASRHCFDRNVAAQTRVARAIHLAHAAAADGLDDLVGTEL